MDIAGCSCAQWPVAIIQGDLRDRLEQILTYRFKRGDFRNQQRSNTSPNEIGDSAIGGSETERLIGCVNQASGKNDPLGFVTVEQRLRRAFTENR